MSNQKQQAAKSPKAKKLLLFPGDKLIEVLNPDLYLIVDPSTLTQAEIQGIQDDNEAFIDDVEVEVEVEVELGAPNLEDITLISKTMVTDGNKNQYVEFKFNVKNHVGAEVVGVNGYGQ
jgi:transposase